MFQEKNPKIQDHEHVVAYDVDNTLVTPDTTGDICITNPYSQTVQRYRTHQRHIELLKCHKARGKHVRVWSAAGNKWAVAVVKALELEEYVDSIETKPELLIDDLPVTEIFPARIYLKE